MIFTCVDEILGNVSIGILKNEYSPAINIAIPKIITIILCLKQNSMIFLALIILIQS